MNNFVIYLIKQYQKHSDPNLKHCRYSPSCSNYGLECFMKFNFFKALLLTVLRILRCNPLFKGGYDPTPKSFVEKTIERIYQL